MSSDSKPKPLPSAAVINAYLEESAARTRMRLPIAKLKVPPAAAAEAPRPPAQKSKALPTTRATTAAAPPAPAIPGKDVSAAPGATPDEASGAEAGWRPFGADEES